MIELLPLGVRRKDYRFRGVALDIRRTDAKPMNFHLSDQPANPHLMKPRCGAPGTDDAGNPTFYQGFTPVSNFNVGAYIYGTGIPQWGASLISNTYAAIKSSNEATAQQAQYRNAGYSSAASGGYITCSRFPWGQ